MEDHLHQVLLPWCSLWCRGPGGCLSSTLVWPLAGWNVVPLPSADTWKTGWHGILVSFQCWNRLGLIHDNCFFKWQCCWKIVSFSIGGGISSVCFPLPPSPVYLWKGKYAESEAQHGVTEPGEVKWVEGGFRLCAPLCWEFLCCPHHPQLDLSAPLCESALSSNMLSLFLPQDLCTRSAFCQEHFLLSSPEGCFSPS